jgi:hypothetical protein
MIESKGLCCAFMVLSSLTAVGGLRPKEGSLSYLYLCKTRKATNQAVAHLVRDMCAISFRAPSKHEGTVDPLFFDLEADDILSCKFSS